MRWGSVTRRKRTKMKIRSVAVISVVVAALIGSVRAADKREDAAQVAADSWLKLVDDGKYEASWDQAAKLFKGAVTKDQWKQAAVGVREPLGKVVSRKLKSQEPTERL